MVRPSLVSQLSRVFGKGKPERWRVLQIEITSRCPMRCTFCPNKTVGAQWIHGDLPFEVYRDNIVPHLARFDLAYLQGWGEPLLHPRIWEMIRLAKGTGCQVGFTTCGRMLDEANGARLLDEGIDILSISFAGATRETHEALRVGSPFEELTAHVKHLAIARRTRHKALRLEVHFLMMRPNVHELPAFVRLAASLGADEVIATNVAYAPTPAIDALHVFAAAPDPAHLAYVAESGSEAKRLGLKFKAYPLTPEPNVLECDAKPTEIAFVNHLGQVTPCVYLGLPVKETAPRLVDGEEHPVAPVSFGNVRDGLIEAMQSTARADFLRAFRARRAAAYAAFALSVGKGAAEANLPAPPLPCQHCYKMYGI